MARPLGEMRVVIVGAGAMGSLFGFFLNAAGKNVWLLDNHPGLTHHITTHGLALEGISGNHRVFLPITTSPADIEWADLIIIFVKAYDTAQAIADVRPLVKEDSVVLTLQNGIGNVETIVREVGEDKTCAGTTAHGATVLGPGHVRHAGKGETIIGAIRGEAPDRLERVRAFLKSAGIAVNTTKDVTGLLWSKLLINVGINPLTAITGLRNGDLLYFSESREIMHRAVLEARDVAAKKGIQLVYDNPLQKVESVCEATAENISSMLQDLRSKKRTEIDYINGAVVGEGQKIGLPLPVNQALTHLIHTLEALTCPGASGSQPFVGI